MVSLGGRSELQFNFAIEAIADPCFRYGVAFSFELSRTVPSIDIFIPKVRRFNDFMSMYPSLYEDMRMWHYQGAGNQHARSSDYSPSPISSKLVQAGNFVFLGDLQSVNQIDYDLILSIYDKLLPLYEYVEGRDDARPASTLQQLPFTFRPGCSPKASWATATLLQRKLDVRLRHNELQDALYHQLAISYGAENVGTELQLAIGAKIDVVLRYDGSYWFYEIKTAGSVRACIREAVGQLLEYAFWPGERLATRLIVVGEASLDGDGARYLDNLNA